MGVGMNFWWMIEQIYAGKGVTRDAWDARGWVIRVKRPEKGSDMGQPYLYITHEKGLVPWHPQQWDIDATDYKLAPEAPVA